MKPEAQCEDPSALIFQIKRSAMEDGPGIRTNVFIKGCPLRCKWCCNPEGQETQPELPAGAEVHDFFERLMSVSEIMEIVVRDKPFYDATGGGVTVAGGEPTMHVRFTGELLRRCKALGIHTALDTCGFAEGAAADLLNQADMLLFDLKIINEEKHIAATGKSNRPILENYHRLGASGKPMRVRMPLIPGYTDDAENLEAVARLAAKYPNVERLDIIPFHNYAIPKYEVLHKLHILSDIPLLPKEKVEEIRAYMAEFGANVKVGG